MGTQSISIPDKYKTKFRNLKVGESFTIPWDCFPKRPEGPATMGLGKSPVWEMKPTDDGMFVKRLT